MLPQQAIRDLVASIPTQYKVDNSTVNAGISMGNYTLADYTKPIINLSIPVEDNVHFRSIEDFHEIKNDTLYNSTINSAILRFKVTSTHMDLQDTIDLTFYSGQLEYVFSAVPVLEIISVQISTVELDNSNYEINDNYTGIVFTGDTPSDGENFTVEYKYRLNSYYVASQITKQLKNEHRFKVREILSPYQIAIHEVGNIDNISEIHNNTQLDTFVFDTKIVYKDTWSRPLTSEDGTLLDRVNVDMVEDDSGHTDTYTIE